MRRITTLAVLLASTASIARAEVPSIVADIAPVHGLVSMVTGDITTPSMLIEPTASPHSNAIRPSVAAALQDADVVFWIGSDLSPWLEDPIETLAPDAQHSALLSVAGTQTLSFRETNIFASDKDDHGHDEHGDEHASDEADHEDHAEDAADHDDQGHEEHEEEAHDDHGDEGHDHSGIDPHAWLSPTNAGVWLTHIAETLSTLDPDNAATYAANADSAKAQIAKEVEAAQTLLTPAQDRPFAVFHDAYHYFEDQFGLEVIGAISLRDAVPPSPAQVAEVQREIRENGVVCVFSEPQFSDALVQTVIEGTDAKTAQLDPVGANLDLGAGFYPALIRDMTDRLVDCLQ